MHETMIIMGGMMAITQNNYYYGRRGNYDEGLRFNPKLDIPEFDGIMDANEFLN